MRVPSVVGKWAFSLGWTAYQGGAVVLGATLGGDRALIERQTRRWSGGLARACGMEVEVRGVDHVEPACTYVIMANHQSHTDIVALFEALPFVPGFLAKKELRRTPFLGPAMEKAGHVFIDRTRRDRAFEAIAEAADRVREGRCLVVFPEGTRSGDGTVKAFKKGGFHLTKQSGVPLLPVGIRGTAAVLPKNTVRLRPGHVVVTIGEPLSSEEVAGAPLSELMRRVHVRICELSGLPPRDPLLHASDAEPRST